MNDIFENNKQNLLLINEIVANYRKQKFFVGSLKLSALLKNINSVVEVIFSREDCRDLAGELEQILPALLQAQDDQDYILQADILEGDLLPLLQKIQIKLQEEGMPQVLEFFESNMLILKEKNERLYKVLQNVRNDNAKYVIAYAINGQPTVQARNGNRCFFMHSTMNPEWEAQVLAAGLPAAKNYVVFGMGLGYHVIELLKKYPENKVTVLESEKYLLLQALRYMDWTTYFKENRIEIVYEPDITELIGYLKQMKDYELFMHYPTVQAVENPSIRTLLEDFFITTSSMREQERFLDANFEKLSERHLPECSEIKKFILQKKCCNCWCRTICKSGITVIETISKQYHDFCNRSYCRYTFEGRHYPGCYHHNRSTAAYVSAGEGTGYKKDSIDTSVDSVLVCSGLL